MSPHCTPTVYDSEPGELLVDACLGSCPATVQRWATFSTLQSLHLPICEMGFRGSHVTGLRHGLAALKPWQHPKSHCCQVPAPCQGLFP